MTSISSSFPIYISQILGSTTLLSIVDGVTIGKRSLSLQNTAAWGAAVFKPFTLKASKPFNLFLSVNAATTFVEIRDEQGNAVIPVRVNPLTQAFVITLLPYFTYNFAIITSGAIPIGTNLVTITGQITPNVQSYFSNGFENQIPSTETRITSSTDAFGQLTYTFSNFPVTTNQKIVLALATFANQSGNITVTSSNTSVFNTFSDPFNPGSSIYIAVKGLSNTLFSGTVTISIPGVGTTSNVDLDVIGDPPYLGLIPYNNNASTRTMLSAKRKKESDDEI